MTSFVKKVFILLFIFLNSIIIPYDTEYVGRSEAFHKDNMFRELSEATLMAAGH